jgi:hypothetical protein
VENQEINLTITIAEANVILTSLSNGQYSVVAELIQKIRSQALSQIEKTSAMPVEVSQKQVEK